MKKIYQKLSKSVLLLSSLTLFSVGQVVETQAQTAPALKVRYKSMRLSERQCVNRAFSLLNRASSATQVARYGSYVVGAYAGTTTVTVTCIANNGVVVFNAAGLDGSNVDQWVNWLANNF